MRQTVPILDNVEIEAAGDLLIGLGRGAAGPVARRGGVVREAEGVAPPVDVALEARERDGEECVRLGGVGGAEEGVAPRAVGVAPGGADELVKFLEVEACSAILEGGLALVPEAGRDSPKGRGRHR